MLGACMSCMSDSKVLIVSALASRIPVLAPRWTEILAFPPVSKKMPWRIPKIPHQQQISHFTKLFNIEIANRTSMKFKFLHTSPKRDGYIALKSYPLEVEKKPHFLDRLPRMRMRIFTREELGNYLLCCFPETVPYIF